MSLLLLYIIAYHNIAGKKHKIEWMSQTRSLLQTGLDFVEYTFFRFASEHHFVNKNQALVLSCSIVKCGSETRQVLQLNPNK